MKTKEEIEQLAEQDFKFWQDCGHYELADLKSIDYYYDGFFYGYTQCQEDKKYTEEDVINALHSVELRNNKDYSKIFEGMKDYLHSLNKKD